MEEAGGGQDTYRLSYEILGHSADVRVVCYCPLPAESLSNANHVLLTASRDGTACVWEPEGAPSRSYFLKKVVRKHAGYVSALCVIPEDKAAGREESEEF
jgi:WD40 repeat protein